MGQVLSPNVGRLVEIVVGVGSVISEEGQEEQEEQDASRLNASVSTTDTAPGPAPGIHGPVLCVVLYSTYNVPFRYSEQYVKTGIYTTYSGDFGAFSKTSPFGRNPG